MTVLKKWLAPSTNEVSTVTPARLERRCEPLTLCDRDVLVGCAVHDLERGGGCMYVRDRTGCESKTRVYHLWARRATRELARPHAAVGGPADGLDVIGQPCEIGRRRPAESAGLVALGEEGIGGRGERLERACLPPEVEVRLCVRADVHVQWTRVIGDCRDDGGGDVCRIATVHQRVSS